jgi:hypothetical protein
VVEAILIFTQVPLSVFLEVEGMVCPIDGGLQVAEYGIDPGEALHVGAFATMTNYLPLMIAPGFGNCPETP